MARYKSENSRGKASTDEIIKGLGHFFYSSYFRFIIKELIKNYIKTVVSKPRITETCAGGRDIS